MNLQPPPPPPVRPPTSCLRHPGQHPTGLCAPCLAERLSLLNPDTTSLSSSSSPDPTKSSSSSVRNAGKNSITSSSSIFRQLRRCNTFSGKKGESIGFGLLSGCEPRRNSCDVRGRNSLSELFNLEDEGRGHFEVRPNNLGTVEGEVGVENGVDHCVGDDEIRVCRDEIGVCEDEIRVSGDDGDDEIRVSGDGIEVTGDNNNNTITDFEEQVVRDLENNVNRYRFEEAMMMSSKNKKKKTIKEFIDLESSSSSSSSSKNKKSSSRRDFKEIAGSFWIAASVFSRKLQKWKRKQRNKRTNGGGYRGVVGGGGESIGWMKGRRLRDTQSEAGEYWLGGRRSTDTDPRCSVDLARASVDGGRTWFDLLGSRKSCDTDPRVSIDLGRASIDGGRMSFRESSSSSRFSIDPGRSSFDRGRPAVSFREGGARFSMDSGRPSVDGGRTASFREAAAAAAGFSVDPGRASLDRGKASFREGILRFPIDPGRLSYDGGKTTSSREVTAGGLSSNDPARVSFDGSGGRSAFRDMTGGGGFLFEPSRASYDGGRTSFRGEAVTRCALDRGKAAVASSSFGDMGRSSLYRAESVLDRNWSSSRYTTQNHLDTGVLRFNLPPLKAYKRSNVEKSRFNRSNSMARTILKLY